MMLLFDLIALAFGLAFGSFANVLIFRLGGERKSLTEPSACRHCGQKILPRDNVPVISWLILRGRCRACGAGISALYPTIEIATASLFVLAINQPAALSGIHASSSNSALAASLLVTSSLWWLACAGTALAVIDFQTYRLPNALVVSIASIGVMGLGAASILRGDSASLIRAGSGALVSAIIFGLIVIIAPNGMGIGDLKLSAVLGFYLGWFGWGALIIGWLLAFGLGSAFGLGLLVTRRAKKRTMIAFGPWMIVGAFLAIGVGNEVWKLYLQFLQQALV